MADLKVVQLPGVSTVDDAFKHATETGLSEVLVLGWTKDGQLYMHGTVLGATGEALHLVEAFKFEMMAGHSGLKG